jgi:hypothetical protein
VWQFIPEGEIPHERLMGPHHDVWRKDDGNTLLICRQAVPEENLQEVGNPLWQNQQIYGDTILEVNPDGEVVWEWNSHGHLDINHYRLVASPGWFAGPYNSTVMDTSSAPRLPNGNTLICESVTGLVFEVTVEGETVWEYVGCGPRAYRYGYDYCPQLAALNRPKEVAVTPPEELHVSPEEPLD